MNIKSLTLFTSQLEAQYKFYTQTLGFKSIEKSEESFSLQVGDSVLTFNKKEKSTPYHFALNIPYDAIEDALQWTKEKVGVLKNGRFEIHEFEDWEARAVYFYDEDKNIVEFIGRKGLNYEYAGSYDISCIKEISEIGVATTDIESCYNSLSLNIGLEIYDGGFYRFCAIGDEKGLFICVNPEEKKWFPTDDTVYYSGFKAIVKRYNLSRTVTYENGEIAVGLS